MDSKRFLTPWTDIFHAFRYDQPVFILHNSKIDINHDIPKCISLNNISFRFIYIRDNVTRTFFKMASARLFVFSRPQIKHRLRNSHILLRMEISAILTEFFPLQIQFHLFFLFLLPSGGRDSPRVPLFPSAPQCHIETTFRHCIYI